MTYKNHGSTYEPVHMKAAHCKTNTRVVYLPGWNLKSSIEENKAYLSYLYSKD